MNNLEIVTETPEKYETAFGFTQDEVYVALKEKEDFPYFQLDFPCLFVLTPESFPWTGLSDIYQ